jgi:uncharacterized RDD family membrane protein YckC
MNVPPSPPGHGNGARPDPRPPTPGAGAYAAHGGGHAAPPAHGAPSAYGAPAAHGSRAEHGPQAPYGAQAAHGSRAEHGSRAPYGAPSGTDAGEGPFPLASWTSRALARLVDLVVAGLPAMALALILSLALFGLTALGSGGVTGGHFPLLFAVVFFLVHTAYETVSLRRWGQTLGKRVVGLKVAPVAAVGRLGRLPIGAVTTRAALYGLPMLLVQIPGWLWWPVFWTAVVLIGGMPAWNRPNRQGLHDRIAGTVVLNVRP